VGGRSIQIPADMLNLGFVLGNKVMVGTVNANREYLKQECMISLVQSSNFQDGFPSS